MNALLDCLDHDDIMYKTIFRFRQNKFCTGQHDNIWILYMYIITVTIVYESALFTGHGVYNNYSSIWKCSILRTLSFFTLSLDILEACPLRVIRVKQTTIGRVRPWIGDLEWNYWVILNKVKTTPPCFYSNLSHRLAHWEFSQITDPQLYENLRRFLSLPIFMSQFRFYFC